MLELSSILFWFFLVIIDKTLYTELHYLTNRMIISTSHIFKRNCTVVDSSTIRLSLRPSSLVGWLLDFDRWSWCIVLQCECIVNPSQCLHTKSCPSIERHRAHDPSSHTWNVCCLKEPNVKFKFQYLMQDIYRWCGVVSGGSSISLFLQILSPLTTLKTENEYLSSHLDYVASNRCSNVV